MVGGAVAGEGGGGDGAGEEVAVGQARGAEALEEVAEGKIKVAYK